MTTYEVRYTKSAYKELEKLPGTIQKRILVALLKLASNPRSGNVRPMVGSTAWRLRIGDYRVVYDINDTQIVIVVIRISHRKDVYRRR